MRTPVDPARVDVVVVLCLLEAAFGLLGGVGEVLLMGGAAAYLALPAAKALLLGVLAGQLASGRGWAAGTLIVLQLLTLSAYLIQLELGLLPWVDATVNLVGLVTNVVVPGAVIWLTAAALRTPPPEYAVPQDPYAPAPLVTVATPTLPLPIEARP